jgi:dTDP-glucose 4,6-dehydratase
MKILVTGCLGFIGSHFVRYVLEHNPDVKIIGIDNNASQFQTARLGDLLNHPNFRLIVADINGDLSEAFDGIDVIVNFAAKTFVDHSVKYPNLHLWNNVNGVFNILNNARLSKPGLLVQISTDEVYGEALGDLKSYAESPLHPTNPYAASKACADMLVSGMGKTYNIPYLITRCENNYGPFQHPQKALPTFIKAAMGDTEYLPVYSPGTQRRCWLHVEDHCSAIWFLIQKNQHGIVNIGNNQELDNLTLAKKVLKSFGKDESSIMMIDTGSIRPHHDARYLIDVVYLEELGWMPRYSLDVGLDLTIDWYKNNPEWLNQ